MSVFKCKMCGGTLEINENATTAECEYCGSIQTLTKSRDEIVTNLFNRANNLRMKSEFDKAQEMYEKIVAQDSTDAEAYWGILLCKYGIEYVEDPSTFKRVPTCHRAQIESVLTDVDYQSAIENADINQKILYEKQAKEIEEVQKGILEISSKEEPFDVFICYKQSDENGNRTVDSVLANDIYYQLTQEGFKVFYAAITLEDKIGQEYEPYIFAALNSAKVMLVLGTKPEYFNAVWVKNEWSRYLKIIKKDRSKLLIPCYKDMDAYELPEEFSHLQAQDMSKIGFINDVVRGIKKVLDTTSETPNVVQTNTAITSDNSQVDNLLKRVFMFLEDKNWERADEYCEKVLDLDSENGEAYLGKLCVVKQLQSINELEKIEKSSYENVSEYVKAKKFANDELLKKLEDIEQKSIIWLERKKQEEIQKKEEEIKKKKQKKEEDTRRLLPLIKKHRYYQTLIAGGYYYTVGVKSDGTVLAVGNNRYGECDVSNWRNIIAVASGGEYTVGLKSDGTVVATGRNDVGQCDVSEWREIVAIAAAAFGTVGLRSDGTVVATREVDKECLNWRDVIEISMGTFRNVYGLRSDGEYYSTSSSHKHRNNEKVAAFINGEDGTNCGDIDNRCKLIMQDGTVESEYIKLNDIIAGCNVSVITAGLKSDGTIVVAERTNMKFSLFNELEDEDSMWKDIVAVSGRGNHIVGLKSDGRVVAFEHRADNKTCRYLDVGKWKLCDSVENFEQERQEIELKRQQQEKELKIKINDLRVQRSDLGIFEIKRRKEIKNEIKELQNQLSDLSGIQF